MMISQEIYGVECYSLRDKEHVKLSRVVYPRIEDAISFIMNRSGNIKVVDELHNLYESEDYGYRIIGLTLVD